MRLDVVEVRVSAVYMVYIKLISMYMKCHQWLTFSCDIRLRVAQNKIFYRTKCNFSKTAIFTKIS